MASIRPESKLGGAVAAGSHGHDDSRFGRGFHIDVVDVIPRLRDEFQIGQRFEQRGGEFRALADRNDRLGALEGMAHRLFGGEFLGEDLDVRLPPQPFNGCGGLESMLVVV